MLNSEMMIQVISIIIGKKLIELIIIITLKKRKGLAKILITWNPVWEKNSSIVSDFYYLKITYLI